MTTDDEPAGWRKLWSAEVWVDDKGALVIMAAANDVWPNGPEGDGHPHNCDRMGCGSIGGHVVHRGNFEEGT